MSRLFAEAAAYAVFILLIGLLSTWPEYRLLADSEAVLSMTFSHAARRVEECRQLSQDELNALPPNMRKPAACPRRRHGTRVELHIDGQREYSGTAPASGLWNDGKASIYRRFNVPAGEHEIFIGMNDSGTSGRNDYELRQRAVIEAGQNLVITFDDLAGSFVIE